MPLPQGPRAQEHPAIAAEMPAFSQHQHHPGEQGTWLRLLLDQQLTLPNPVLFSLPLGRVLGCGVKVSLVLLAGPWWVGQKGVLCPHW